MKYCPVHLIIKIKRKFRTLWLGCWKFWDMDRWSTSNDIFIEYLFELYCINWVQSWCLTILSYAIEINIYVWTKKYKLKIISKWEIRPHVWSLVWKEFAFFLCNLFSSIHCKIELQLSLKMITDEFKCSYKRISNVIWAPIMANALDARIKVHLMWKDIFYIDGTYAALK